MTPDPQLLTKQIIAVDISIVGITIPVRFNLQRGKIARIWGLSYGVVTIATLASEYTLFVRKTANAERVDTPSDLLWSSIQTNLLTTSGRGTFAPDHVMFPKPYRTSGITVQFHCSVNSNSRGLLIMYYDIDDVAKGELVQRWEKSRQKKYDRRMLAP